MPKKKVKEIRRFEPNKTAIKYDWQEAKLLVASGNTLSDVGRMLNIPINQVTKMWSLHPNWPQASRETIMLARKRTKAENQIKLAAGLPKTADALTTLEHVETTMKAKAALFCEGASQKLLAINTFVNAQPITSRKDAMADGLIIKTAAQAAEVVMGLRDKSPTQNVMVNLSLNNALDEAIEVDD